ncbi:MAG: NADH-quinone oxidoreductase subunit A [Cyclobacteriaceae bacterium]|nr:NADH-quinone oxidoreductase subunit A [Cyclobacteriaceae bacterium]
MNGEPTPVYFQILLFFLGGVLFVAGALLVSRLLRPNRPGTQKLSSYESGETPQGHAWIQFNLRFYVLALVFILFEVEIVFLFPWSVVFANKELIDQTKGAWGWYTFAEMLIFIFILALGLAYAWKKGHLDWIKSSPEIKDVNSPVPDSLYSGINEKYKSSKVSDTP